MTVTTTATSQTFAGNGVSTTFPFTFAVSATSSILVFITSAGGTVTQLTQGGGANQFQVVFNPPVSPNPTPVGGTVTYTGGGTPVPIGATLTITRSTPQTQTTGFSNQGTTYPQAIESTFDELQCQVQEGGGSGGGGGGGGSVSARAILVAVSDPTPNPLPPVAQRANLFMAFDGAGNPIAVSGGGGGGSNPIIGTVTLVANQTSTTVTSSSVTGVMQVVLQARTANAAASVPTTFISSVSSGQFVIAHASNANVDRTFGWVAAL